MSEEDRLDMEADLAELTTRRRLWLWAFPDTDEAGQTPPLHRRIGVVEATAEETAWLSTVGDHGGPVLHVLPFEGSTTIEQWYEDHPEFPRDASPHSVHERSARPENVSKS